MHRNGKKGERMILYGAIGLPGFMLKILSLYTVCPLWTKMSNLLIPCIREKRNGTDGTNSGEAEDFISMMIDKYPDLSDHDIALYLIGIIFAAHSTTKNALARALICLSTLPSLVEKIRAEIMQNVDQTTMSLTPESAKNMKLTEACILETVRLASPAIGLAIRKALVDIEYCDGTIIPKGTIFSCSGYIHHNSSIFPNADQFNPDRWLTSDKPNPAHFLGFGSNAHVCPGRFFAILEVQVSLAMILSKYNISSVTGNEFSRSIRLRKSKFGIKFSKIKG